MFGVVLWVCSACSAIGGRAEAAIGCEPGKAGAEPPAGARATPAREHGTQGGARAPQRAPVKVFRLPKDEHNGKMQPVHFIRLH